MYFIRLLTHRTASTRAMTCRTSSFFVSFFFPPFLFHFVQVVRRWNPFFVSRLFSLLAVLLLATENAEDIVR